MVTNVYYFKHYAPYIINNARRRRIADYPRSDAFIGDGDETYVLNKSLKKEVVGYATELSRAVNGLKDSSKYIVQDARAFVKNEKEAGLVKTVGWMADNISNFIESYNRTISFANKNKDSRVLTEFADDLSYDLSVSLTALSRYHMTEDDGALLAFDESALKNDSKKNVRIANKQNLPFFEHVYDSSGKLLTAPLSEHMNFKNLKYYYNYKTGKISQDTFAIIGSGMIVNEGV